MKNSIFMILSLRVVLLFIVAIFSTFIGDSLSTFLGDWNCDILGTCHSGYEKEYITHVHWGYRHWLYFTMCIILFIIQVVSIVDFYEKYKKQN